MANKKLRIAQIRTDGGTQLRVSATEDVVQEYTEAILNGAKFPPVVVFRDGDVFWLADGFCRLAAHQRAEHEQILAEIHIGTQREAVLFAAGANARHGVQRTQADTRNAIERLLKDPEWQKWSDNSIAKKVGVSHHTVARCRKLLSNPSLGNLPSEGLENPPEHEEQPQSRTYTTKHGTVAEMATANIGKKPIGKTSKDDPQREPDREPGDDTETIEQEKKKEKAKPKNGTELYSVRGFENIYGQMIRDIDALGHAYGVRDTPRTEGFRRRLAEYYRDYTAYREELAKELLKKTRGA